MVNNNIYMYKDYSNLEYVNNIFYLYKETDEYLIGKRYDTLCDEFYDISAVKKDEFFNSMYSVNDFFKGSKYIGKTGYYKGMSELEIKVYNTLILVYKDEFNELLYDTILDKIYVSPSIYDEKDFVESGISYPKVKFKKGLGLK